MLKGKLPVILSQNWEVKVKIMLRQSLKSQNQELTKDSFKNKFRMVE